MLKEAWHLAYKHCKMQGLILLTDNLNQTCKILKSMEGNLTGTIYSAKSGEDNSAYDLIAPILLRKVGRLLNDKMPTGVAVSPAMNHGGPFPATGHPGYTAVGIPAAITRFAQLQCFDNIRPERLPQELQDDNPLGIWRCVDGEWQK